MMIVNEWVKTLWTVLNVRPKTLSNYKHNFLNLRSLGEISNGVVQPKHA